MIWTLFILVIFFATPVFAQHGVEMIDITVKNNEILGNDNLSDILRHCEKDSFKEFHGRTTQAHETVHIINSFARNEMFSKGRKRTNVFYCGQGKALVVENPSFNLTHVSNFIPGVLRGPRHKLYLVNQLEHWGDTPTYLLDEWSAYIAGAETGVEDLKNSLPKENSDVVFGTLEFSIYCVALCMAAKEYDNNYWESNKRLKHTVNYFLIRAEKVYFLGCDSFKSEKQSSLLNHLRFHKDAEEMRSFFLKEFNGIFLK
jgi:hypothetical protein